MKKSDAVLEISKKLQKQKHMYKKYASGGMSLKQLCDNLALRVLTQLEELGMAPPHRKAKPEDFANDGFDQEFLDDHDFKVSDWESENVKEKSDQAFLDDLNRDISKWESENE